MPVEKEYTIFWPSLHQQDRHPFAALKGRLLCGARTSAVYGVASKQIMELLSLVLIAMWQNFAFNVAQTYS